jgi:hypothetical protein
MKYRDPDWAAQVDFDKLEKLAALGYKPEQCAMYFGVPVDGFMYFYMLFESKLKYHYEKGILMHKALEGMTMLADAESGENITNAQRLDKMRRELEFENSKNDIIYGGI